jgi:hypothetical protein
MSTLPTLSPELPSGESPLLITETIDCRGLISPVRFAAKYALIAASLVTLVVFTLAAGGNRGNLRMDDFLFYWLLIVPFSTLSVFALVWGRGRDLAGKKCSVSCDGQVVVVEGHSKHGTMRVPAATCRWFAGYTFHDLGLPQSNVKSAILISWPPHDALARAAVGLTADAYLNWQSVLETLAVKPLRRRSRFEREFIWICTAAGVTLSMFGVMAIVGAAHSIGMKFETPIASFGTTALVGGYLAYIAAKSTCGEVVLRRQSTRFLYQCLAIVVVGFLKLNRRGPPALHPSVFVPAISIAACQLAGVWVVFIYFRRRDQQIFPAGSPTAE